MACFSSACLYAQAPGAPRQRHGQRQRHGGWQGRKRAGREQKESRKRAEREEKESQSARGPILFSYRQEKVLSLSEMSALYLGLASEKQSTERKAERGIDGGMEAKPFSGREGGGLGPHL